MNNAFNDDVKKPVLDRVTNNRDIDIGSNSNTDIEDIQLGNLQLESNKETEMVSTGKVLDGIEEVKLDIPNITEIDEFNDPLGVKKINKDLDGILKGSKEPVVDVNSIPDIDLYDLDELVEMYSSEKEQAEVKKNHMDDILGALFNDIKPDGFEGVSYDEDGMYKPVLEPTDFIHHLKLINVMTNTRSDGLQEFSKKEDNLTNLDTELQEELSENSRELLSLAEQYNNLTMLLKDKDRQLKDKKEALIIKEEILKDITQQINQLKEKIYGDSMSDNDSENISNENITKNVDDISDEDIDNPIEDLNQDTEQDTGQDTIIDELELEEDPIEIEEISDETDNDLSIEDISEEDDDIDADLIPESIESEMDEISNESEIIDNELDNISDENLEKSDTEITDMDMNILQESSEEMGIDNIQEESENASVEEVETDDAELKELDDNIDNLYGTLDDIPETYARDKIQFKVAVKDTDKM